MNGLSIQYASEDSIVNEDYVVIPLTDTIGAITSNHNDLVSRDLAQDSMSTKPTLVDHSHQDGRCSAIVDFWDGLPVAFRNLLLTAIAVSGIWCAWSQTNSPVRKEPTIRIQPASSTTPVDGMRVPALNPQGIQSQPDASARDSEQPGAGRLSTAPAHMDITETAFGTPVPNTWRTFRLLVEKEDRTGDLEVTLLRPADWLVEQQQSTLLLAMLAEWQLAEDEAQESSAEIGFSSAVETLEALSRFDPLAEFIDSLSIAADFIGPVRSLDFTDPVRGLAGWTFSEFESAVMEQAEADLAWIAAIDSVLSGEATGSQIWLEMPELGAVGLATVTAIEPCPTIKSGPGRIVTATFKHESADVLDLRFASTNPNSLSRDRERAGVRADDRSSSLQSPASSLSLGVTAAHPFWSVDREDFVPAGELLPQEQVIGIDGQHFRLTSITPRAGPETVYNFEVALDHVYYVGEDGVLVHNAYLTDLIKKGWSGTKKAGAWLAEKIGLRQARRTLPTQIRANGAVQTLMNGGRTLLVRESHWNDLRKVFSVFQGRLNLFSSKYWKHVLPHTHVYALKNAPAVMNANWRKTFEKLGAFKQTFWFWE